MWVRRREFEELKKRYDELKADLHVEFEARTRNERLIKVLKNTLEDHLGIKIREIKSPHGYYADYEVIPPEVLKAERELERVKIQEKLNQKDKEPSGPSKPVDPLRAVYQSVNDQAIHNLQQQIGTYLPRRVF